MLRGGARESTGAAGGRRWWAAAAAAAQGDSYGVLLAQMDDEDRGADGCNIPEGERARVQVLAGDDWSR